MRRPLAAAALLTLALSACDRPGKGRRAEAEYRRSEPVLEALERFHAARGAYPGRLEELVPAFLTAGALAAPAGAEPLEYGRLRDDAFLLTFRYSGPGRNECTWTSATPRWRCRGYF
jgi:hypothetical protein